MLEPDFQLADERLNYRAQYCFSKMRTDPGLSFPQMFSGSGELQGFYRFMGNSRTDVDELVATVIDHTKMSVRGAQKAIAIHDTTHVKPSAKAHRIEEFVNGKGFFAHTTLLIDPDNPRRIYGVGAIKLWSRSKKKGYTGEQKRWTENVAKVEDDFSETNLVHVMDREGDTCPLWSWLFENEHSFVIRAKSDRHVKTTSGEASRLFTEMKDAKIVATRDIDLSFRKPNKRPHSLKAHPPRESRTAHVSISAKSVRVHKTDQHGHSTNETLYINVVRVFESNPPLNEDPMEWLLLTCEPISTKEEVLTVVDYYRARWTIEEFFKGLKTGCKLEERLLEDATAWYRLFVFCLPIATDILNLRINHQIQLRPQAILTKPQLEILKDKALDVGKTIKTGEDVKLQIARLGGHISANGPPGWITLFRGYKQLYLLEQGWLISKNKKM